MKKMENNLMKYTKSPNESPKTQNKKKSIKGNASTGSIFISSPGEQSLGDSALSSFEKK